MSFAEQCLAQAEACRQQAGSSATEPMRKLLLAVADVWSTLAARAGEAPQPN